MKSDLDQILEDNNIDALWVTGPGFNNPVMVPDRRRHLTAADLILSGQPPCSSTRPWRRGSRPHRLNTPATAAIL